MAEFYGSCDGNTKMFRDRFSVLVNGTLSGFFSSSRGLRQNDSLSPFLIVIVIKTLSRMLSTTVNGVFSQDFP